MRVHLLLRQSEPDLVLNICGTLISLDQTQQEEREDLHRRARQLHGGTYCRSRRLGHACREACQ